MTSTKPLLPVTTLAVFLGGFAQESKVMDEHLRRNI